MRNATTSRAPLDGVRAAARRLAPPPRRRRPGRDVSTAGRAAAVRTQLRRLRPI